MTKMLKSAYGSFTTVDGVRFTFTAPTPLVGVRDRWVAEPLACDVYVYENDYRNNDGSTTTGYRFGKSAMIYSNRDRAMQKAIVEKKSDIEKARALVSTYDAAVAKLAKTHGRPEHHHEYKPTYVTERGVIDACECGEEPVR